MAMFSIDTKEIHKLESELSRVAKRAIPFATKSTVNDAAFLGMRMAKSRVRLLLTLRNKWTEKSIRVRTTKTLDVSRQAAYVGSTEDYMEDQEFGATKRRKGKEGVPLATTYASGEGENATPRKKLPRKPNKIRNIRLSKRRTRGRSKKQTTLIRIRQAIQTGNRRVYLDTGRTKGIFRVLRGTKKNPQNARIKMLHNLDHSSVRVPKEPWLHPSVEQVGPHIPHMYAKNLRFQLKRLNLLQ